MFTTACLVVLVSVMPAIAQDNPVPATVDSAFIDSLFHEIENARGDDGASVVYYDSSRIMRRAPSHERMERYLSDKDFQYDHEVKDPESLLAIIMAMIGDLIKKLFGNNAEADFWTWALRIIAVLSLVGVILSLVKADLRALLMPRSEGARVGFSEIEENIHAMNFDVLIDEAVAARNYRRAVRLLYLRSLKELADRGLIDWRRGKTNHEYLDELRAVVGVGASFADATWLFEYVWYGDLPVTEPTFRSIRETFADLSSTIVRGS